MRLLRPAALLAAALAAPAAAAAAQPADKPDLIVAISVDQLSSELFEQYRASFTGGLARMARGTVFARGYQAHAATETCPGHATILTGVHPARAGIIANNWMDLAAAREDKTIYCAEDESVAGSTSRKYTVSPVHLKVPAFGDRMKAADPQARVVAVAGKDRSAVMMGGHQPDQRWWWSGGRFVTHEGAVQPPVTAQANASIAAALARPRMPMPLSPLCAPKVKAVPIGNGATVGTHRFERDAGNVSGFTASPELDAATLAMAAALTQQLQLGRSGRTDLLAIGLAATDYVGHRFGTQGVEMCIQLETLDDDLGSFFDLLDRSGIDYAVMLTADHGGLDLPERDPRQGNYSVGRIDTSLTEAEINKAVAAATGLSGTLLHADGSDIYIDRTDQARHAAIAAAARRIIGGHPQVETVLTRAELSAMPLPTGSPEAWTPAQRARASFDPARSGDLVMLLKPRIQPIPAPVGSYVATHGSPWDYDRQVPILFWRKGMGPSERAEPAQTVDIMPTLAALIGLKVPQGEIDGRCLDVAGASC